MPPRPNRHIHFHPFADGGVLHLKGSHHLWVLNITSATLWCLLDGQANADDLALAYRARFGIDQTAARKDVKTLLAQFEQWGLLNDGKPKGQNGRIAKQPPERPQVDTISEEDISGLERMTFALTGLSIAVALDDVSLAEYGAALFQNLAAEAEPAGSCVELAITNEDKENGRTFFGCQNGMRAGSGLTKNEVIPWLIYKLFDHGLAGLNNRLLFHAAVVAKHSHSLLLPAVSGSGKSTLAAALTASGWTYLSDELAVVDPQNLRVEPFALPIGLKDKSMAPLADFVPGIEAFPRHIRADGTGLRYFPPPDAASAGGLPIQALVFPHYSRGCTTKLKALKPLECLQKLAATGSSARPLASKDIAAILQLAALPGYQLRFSDLKAALDQLNGLLPK